MKKSALLTGSVTRRVMAVVTAVLVGVALIGSTGCSVDEGPAIQKQVESEFDSLTNVSSDTIDEVIGDDFTSTLEGYGVEPTEFYGALVGHFSYEVNDVTVKDDKATVSLTATNVDVTSIFSTWQTEFSTYVQTDEALALYQSEGEDGLIKQAFTMLMTDLNASDAPTVTADVTIDLTKDSDGTWQFDDESQLTSALFGGEDISSIAQSTTA